MVQGKMPIVSNVRNSTRIWQPGCRSF